MTTQQVRRLLILGLTVGAVISIVAVVLYSTRGQGGGPGTADQPSAPAIGRPSGATQNRPPRATITALGAAKGYDATVRVVPAEDGASRFDVDLSTESEPASAPTAQAQLQGPGAARRTIGLTVIGAGRWQSPPLTLSRGVYRLTIRFDRRGGPLSIPVPFRVP